MSLDLSQINELHLNSDAFMRMQRLRFLKFYSCHYNKGKKENDKVQLCEGLEELPDELRYLHWHRYPLRSLPSKFKPENLVDLQMHHSNVEYLWNENQYNLEKLRRIDLSHSQHLTEIPNLSGASNLQIIVLNGCSRITKFPKICNLKSLSILDLSGCFGVDKMLEDLSKPLSSSSGLSSLKELNLSKCNLSTFPSALSCLSFLVFLDVSGNNFESLSLEPFSCLTRLNISHCKRLQSVQEFPLPSRLLDLQARHCISLETLPTSDVVFTGNWNSQHSFIYYNCLKLDANARDNMEEDSVSFCFCFPRKEIPELFSHQYRGSSVVIKLPPHWCSTKFLGFALCVVAAFEDCEYSNYFCINCKYYFLTKDGELYELAGDLKVMELDGRLGHGFMESDHVFLLYAHGLSTGPQPIPNCKIKKCGVHLLYLEEETTQISGDDSINKAGLVESGGDGIPNTVEDEETEQHNSESEAMQVTECGDYRGHGGLRRYHERIVENCWIKKSLESRTMDRSHCLVIISLETVSNMVELMPGSDSDRLHQPEPCRRLSPRTPGDSFVL
ncbi:hypothetical protein EZV62_011966 [Acer yangbiense]|uniref:Uncharacterized protein n=1 Tax=Acer yangbiense TaxID=1000413 RepID=A0A5C7I8N2_9ROSI|nr:hypothetical protein EZV62_011966 [Acer yangbiense]